MKFDDLIRYKALHLKYTMGNSDLTEMVLNSPNGGNVPVPMKNVCALLSQQLFDRFSETCGLLDISKRLFIEKALVEALDKADAIMQAEQIEEHLVAASQSEAA